jgi:hypothetical protein
VKVVVDGQEFIHQVTKLHQVGVNYKRVSIALGPHFNDLEQSKYKQSLAKAVIATQLSLRLAGFATDLDRHGGNIKIEGNTIHHFDLGAMNLAPISDEDKHFTGKIIGETVLGLAQGEKIEPSWISSLI